jgi:hypothetical protein
MNRILIYVEGGVVHGVRADNSKGLDITVFDVDNLIDDKSKDEVYKDWEKLSKGTKEIY